MDSLLDDERCCETQWLRRFLHERQQEEERESRLQSSCLTAICDDDETVSSDKTFLPTFVAEPDLDAQILDWASRFLAIKQCPQELSAIIARRIVQDIRRDDQMLMVCRNIEKSDGSATVFESSKLEKVLMEVVFDVCLDWNDNFPLDLLPAVSTVAENRLVSSSAIKNGRRTMEDQHVVVPDLNLLLGLKDHPAQSFYAVFDGHAGFEAANYAAVHLHHNIVKADSYPSDPVKAIKEGFLKTDEMFLRKAELEDLKSGTTALCCLIRDKTLYVGWLGDSQACLVRRGSPVELVNPHKPSRQDERDRIDALGGCVVYFGTWRVNGSLAVSRAIGDVSYKPHVSADADVTVTELDGTEDFLILGCDGLWDVKTPTEAALHVYNHLEQNPGNGGDVASKLVVLAKNGGSCDNITVIVVFLRNIGDLHGPCPSLGVDATKTVVLGSPGDSSRHFPYGYPSESQEAQHLFMTGQSPAAVPDLLPQETLPKWSNAHDDEIQVATKETPECLLGLDSFQEAVHVDGTGVDDHQTVQSVGISSSEEQVVVPTTPGTNPFAAEFTPRETLLSSSSSSSTTATTTTNIKYDYFSSENLGFETTNVTRQESTFSSFQSPEQDAVNVVDHHHHPEVAGLYSTGVCSSNDVIFEREALESQDADSGIDASPQDTVPNAEVCEEHNRVFEDPIEYDGAQEFGTAELDGHHHFTENETRSAKLSEEESEKVRAADSDDDALVQGHSPSYPTNTSDLFGVQFGGATVSGSGVSASGVVTGELYDAGVDLYGAEYNPVQRHQVTSGFEGLDTHLVGGGHHHESQSGVGGGHDLLQETELGSEIAEVESELERQLDTEFESQAEVEGVVLQQKRDEQDLFHEELEHFLHERDMEAADRFDKDAAELDDFLHERDMEAADRFRKDAAELEDALHERAMETTEVEELFHKELEDEVLQVKADEREVEIPSHVSPGGLGSGPVEVVTVEDLPQESGTGLLEEGQHKQVETEQRYQTEEVESKSGFDVVVVAEEVTVESIAEEPVAEEPVALDEVLQETSDTKADEPEVVVQVEETETETETKVEMPDVVLSNGINHEDDDVPRKETIAEVLDDDESEDGDEWKFYRGDRSGQEESQQISVQLDFSESETSKVDQPSRLENLTATSQDVARVATPAEPLPEPHPEQEKKKPEVAPPKPSAPKVPTSGATKTGKPTTKDAPKTTASAAAAAKRPLKSASTSATQKAPPAATRAVPSTSRAPVPTNRVLPATTKPASVPATSSATTNKKPIEKPTAAKRPTTLTTAATTSKVGESKRVPLSRPTASATTSGAAARPKPETHSASARPQAAAASASATTAPKRPATVPPKTLATKPRALEAKLTKDAVNQQISTNVKKSSASTSATARTVNGTAGVAQRTVSTRTTVVTKTTTTSSSASATAKLNGVKKEAPKTSSSPSPSKALKISPPISTSSPKRTPTTSAARTTTTPARTPLSATKTSPIRKNVTPASKTTPTSKGSTQKKPVPHSASNGNEKGALDAAAKEGCGGSLVGQTPSPKEGLATNGIHQEHNEASLI